MSNHRDSWDHANQLGLLEVSPSSQHSLIIPLQEEESPGFHAWGLQDTHAGLQRNRQHSDHLTTAPLSSQLSCLPETVKTPNTPLVKQCLCSLPANVAECGPGKDNEEGTPLIKKNTSAKSLHMLLSDLISPPWHKNSKTIRRTMLNGPARTSPSSSQFCELLRLETDPWGLNSILCPPQSLPCGLLDPGAFSDSVLFKCSMSQRKRLVLGGLF